MITTLALPKEEAAALAAISKAEEFLNDANSIEDILKVRDFATASAAIFRVRKAEDAESEAIKLKLKAERKSGTRLNEVVNHEGARTGNKVLPVEKAKLKELGISKSESSRWQKIASVPKERFDKLLEDSTKASQNAILDIAKEFEKELLKENAQEIPIPKKLSVKIYNCDFVDAPVKSNSIDFSLTDPPWAKKFESEWLKLAKFAPTFLKESAHLASFVGSLNFEMGFESLRSSLKFERIICLELNEMHQHLGKYFQEWTPIMVFLKGKCEFPDHYSDRIRDEGSKNKGLHEWSQAVESAQTIIGHFSNTADLLFEPFAGAGSFIEAAINLNRNIIACERDKDAYKILKKRFPEACQD